MKERQTGENLLAESVTIILRELYSDQRIIYVKDSSSLIEQRSEEGKVLYEYVGWSQVVTHEDERLPIVLVGQDQHFSRPHHRVQLLSTNIRYTGPTLHFNSVSYVRYVQPGNRMHDQAFRVGLWGSFDNDFQSGGFEIAIPTDKQIADMTGYEYAQWISEISKNAHEYNPYLWMDVKPGNVTHANLFKKLVGSALVVHADCAKDIIGGEDRNVHLLLQYLAASARSRIALMVPESV